MKGEVNRHSLSGNMIARDNNCTTIKEDEEQGGIITLTCRKTVQNGYTEDFIFEGIRENTYRGQH